MERKVEYIRALIYLGRADAEFHEKEKEYIRKVGVRIGLSDQDLDRELSATANEAFALPQEEVLRFTLLDDLINLMISDGKITEEEIKICEKIANELGFHMDAVGSIINSVKKYLIAGYLENEIQLFVKNELFKLAAKNYYHEKYN